jgi:hypothetical protein
VHEGELIQALGRGRGINRKADNPLDIDLLFDTCLPITVNSVSNWEKPSLLIDTAAKDGVMLTSPVDMVQLWPEVWPNTRSLRILTGRSHPTAQPTRHDLIAAPPVHTRSKFHQAEKIPICRTSKTVGAGPHRAASAGNVPGCLLEGAWQHSRTADDHHTGRRH